MYIYIYLCRNEKGPGTVKDRSKHNKVNNSLRLLFFAATSFVRSGGLLYIYILYIFIYIYSI